MSRIRTIKPEFWTDDLVGSLSRETRLLFIATWNLADDEGRLQWSPPFIKGAVFPFDEDITVQLTEQFMEELTESGVIRSYRGGRSNQRLAAIVNFRKHQKINRPSPSRLPAPPEREQNLPKDNSNMRGSLNPSVNPSVTHSVNGSLTELGLRKGNKEDSSELRSSESRTKPAPKKRLISYPSEFEAKFWNLYPTDPLMSKKTAFKAWDRLNDEDQERASKAIPALKAECRRRGPSYRTPHATTYLNQRRFDGLLEKRAKELGAADRWGETPAVIEPAQEDFWSMTAGDLGG